MKQQTLMYDDKWTKICVNLGICLGKSQGNFHTKSENIVKSFGGGASFFDSHCRCATQFTITTM